MVIDNLVRRLQQSALTVSLVLISHFPTTYGGFTPSDSIWHGRDPEPEKPLQTPEVHHEYIAPRQFGRYLPPEEKDGAWVYRNQRVFTSSLKERQ